MARRKKKASLHTGFRSNKISELLGNARRRSFTSGEISALALGQDLTAANKFRRASLRSGLSSGEISEYYSQRGRGYSEGWILDSGIWNDYTYYDDDAYWKDSSGYNEYYQDVLDYSTAQGDALPSDAVKSLQSSLFDYMVYSGLYDKADSILVTTGDGSTNFKLTDWKTITKRASVSGTVTWDNVLGVKSNGTTGYINLGYSSIARAGYQNNSSFYVHATTALGTTGRTAFGQQIATANYNILRPYASANNLTAAVSIGVSAALANVGNVGRFLLNRSVSGSYKIYKDGALLHTVTASSNAGTTIGNMTLLALNSSLTGTPSVGGFYNDNIAIYINGQDLTSELAMFDAGYAEYYTALSAL